jgi:uncharacterized protein (AIM24 family)
MAIEFRCIRCGQRLRVAAANQGNRARCPTCNAIVDVPGDGMADASSVVSSREKSDVIDYELFGDESQYVEITLDPGEMTAARLESLLYMSPGIAMEKAITEEAGSGGLLDKLSQVGRRILTGSSLRMTAFCNVAERREVVAFAPSAPSRLVPVHLDEYGQQITCQGAAILCAARGIEIRDTDVPSISDVIPMYQMSGDGIAILQSSGQLFHRQLKPKKTISVRTASIVAFTSDIGIAPYDNVMAEEQMPISMLSGPGEIWLKTGS